jgi:hypothetical protein
MNEWVHTFCKSNYVSMNEAKAKRTVIERTYRCHLPVIQHGQDGEVVMTEAKSQPGDKHIEHLGLRMNVRLAWSRAEGGVASTIGHYIHLLNSNSLTTEAALYLTNVLTPTIEYRLRFFMANAKRTQGLGEHTQKDHSQRIQQPDGHPETGTHHYYGPHPPLANTTHCHHHTPPKDSCRAIPIGRQTYRSQDTKQYNLPATRNNTNDTARPIQTRRTRRTSADGEEHKLEQEKSPPPKLGRSHG